MPRIALCLVALMLTSCGEETFEFVCETDKQCDENGDGLCAVQWCAYPDGGCESGYRYAADAEAGVAEECVSEADLAPE